MKILIGSIAATIVAATLLTAFYNHGQASTKDHFKAEKQQKPAQRNFFGGTPKLVTIETGSTTTTPTTAPQADEYNTEETEVEESLEPNVSVEAPNFTPLKSSGNISNAKRCIEWAPKLDELRQKFCPNISVPYACAIWDRENEMRLGGTRGDYCPESNKGAKGCTQFIDATAKTFGRDGDGDGVVNLQSIEDAMASTFTYLCALRKKVGEQYMFQAYQAGPMHYVNPNPANFSPTAVNYDAYIRGHAEIYASALGGKMDLSTSTSSGVMTFGSISVPVPVGECWISSVFGEPRPHRGGRHEGMDLACAKGTRVMAIADCKVRFAGLNNTDGGKRAGIQVQCAHGNGAAGTLALSWYFHLDSVTVKTGDIVKAGQQIGTVGSSGTFSTGPHLHLTTYLWTGGSKTPTLCQYPGIWFPTKALSPNYKEYKGPDTPWARRSAARFEKMWAERK